MTIDAVDEFILSESFQERVERLARELRLAIKFDRPSILLTVYRSEFVRAEAEAHLTEKLSELGQQVVTLRVNEDLSDIPTLLVQYLEREQTVFFISGLRWGGGKDGRDAYRALNIRREYFVEHRIRMVLWLTEAEARDLVYYATDFWAFRHRVVEFVDRPAVKHVKEHAGSLAWQELDDHTFRVDTAAKIALREQLLAELPSGDETMAERAELLYTLGPLYAAQGEYEKAIEAQEEALRLAQALEDTRLQAWSYNSLGNVYHEFGCTNDAIATYQKAIALDPKLAAPQHGLGNVYRDLGHTHEAIEAYQKAIEFDPKYSYPYNGLGNVYRDLGRYDEAVAAYQKAIELDPNDAGAYNGLGNVYSDLGRYDEAVAAYQKAIELDPENGFCWSNLGRLYEENDEYKQALDCYEKALERRTDDKGRAITLKDIGDALRKDGRYDEAVAAYQKAIELDPNDASAYNGLGNVYRDLGRYDEAIEAYQKAIELNSNDANAYVGLADIYYLLRNYYQSFELYQKSYELQPHLKPLVGMAGISSHLGDKEQAEKYAKEARALSPDEYGLACLEAICGNRDEALRLLEIALAKNSTSREWARQDPDFDFIRDDPRFQALVGMATSDRG